MTQLMTKIYTKLRDHKHKYCAGQGRAGETAQQRAGQGLHGRAGQGRTGNTAQGSK